MPFQRLLNLTQLLEKKSFFLFGPRATGKTYLIEKQLGDKALVINLLQSKYYIRLNANPDQLQEIIAASNQKIVVIDEIQRIPQLLNEVHYLIESQKIRFLLTGSTKITKGINYC